MIFSIDKNLTNSNVNTSFILYSENGFVIWFYPPLPRNKFRKYWIDSVNRRAKQTDHLWTIITDELHISDCSPSGRGGRRRVSHAAQRRAAPRGVTKALLGSQSKRADRTPGHWFILTKLDNGESENLAEPTTLREPNLTVANQQTNKQLSSVGVRTNYQPVRDCWQRRLEMNWTSSLLFDSPINFTCTWVVTQTMDQKRGN